MPRSNTLKALFLMIGLPILILLFYFGSSPQNVDSRGNSLKFIVILIALVLIPLLVRSYFKEKARPVTRSVMIGTLIGLSVIVIPLTILLRSLAYNIEGNYLTCVNNYGANYEQRCRDSSKLYIDDLYLNAGLEPGLVAFIMLYTITMVAVLGRKKLQ